MHFKRLPAWAQIICVLAVAFVITWGFWMALRDTFCTIEAKDLLLKRPIRGACFEFWFNRYQAFIAAIIAISGAAWTIAAMKQQTRTETSRILRMNYLHIISELRTCRNAMIDAYSDATGVGTDFDRKTPVPTLSFNKDPKNIGEIPAIEAQSLFVLADEIDDRIDWLENFWQHSPKQIAWEKRQTAALLYMVLEQAIAEFAPKVGLLPTQFLTLHGDDFERVLSSARARDQARADATYKIPKVETV